MDDETPISRPNCGATRKFNLGERSEATAVCSLVKDHDSQHWTIDIGEGWSIIFRWLDEA